MVIITYRTFLEWEDSGWGEEMGGLSVGRGEEVSFTMDTHRCHPPWIHRDLGGGLHRGYSRTFSLTGALAEELVFQNIMSRDGAK
jgi:hypothetical protein